jgi:uncharacterized membrane protein
MSIVSFGLGLGLLAVAIDLYTVLITDDVARGNLERVAWKIFVAGTVCVLLGGGL